MSVKLTPFRVEPRKFHELVVMPQFGDIIDDETGSVVIPSSEEGDWIVMDDVVVSRPVIDLFGNQNILKRRDATCKLIYSPVGRLGNREIKTEKLYAATEDCQEEFYQGAFEDYSQENFNVFGEKVMPLMSKGVASDLYSNKYFGDVTRPADVNGIWSWNKFDGIFTQYQNYITQNIVPAAQTFSIPSGQLTPQQAYDALKNAFNRQDGLLKMFSRNDKAFYVNVDVAEAYWDWLVAAGHSTIEQRMAGNTRLTFKGIEIREKAWDGILTALNEGTEAHAIILTLKGNFIYGTESGYGGGPRRNEAIRVWWSDDDNVWKRQIHMKAGTQIAAPQHSVIGLTELATDSN